MQTNTSNTQDNEKKKEPLQQVFQGKFMRENASFFDILFYNYAKPLLDSSMTQQIKFEQYGELPDRLKIQYEEEKIESEIQHYIKKDPNDRMAFMKGLVSANKWNLSKFMIVRMVLNVN